VKLLAAYAIFLVMLTVLLKRERLPKLPPALYAPLIWIILCLSRSLTQWLQSRADFSSVEADVEGSSVDAIFLSILILIGLRILFKRRVDVIAVIKNNKALFALYGFALLSVLWADVPLIAFKRWTKWAGSLVMVLVILSETDPKAAIRSLVKRSAYALIPLSVLFIKFVPRMGRSFTRSGGVDFHGVATQKNEYGLLLLIFGIYFAWELITIWRRKDLETLKRVGPIDLFFLGVIFWQLFFIDSKTPILCLLLGMGIIFLIGHPYFKGSPTRVRNSIIALVLAAALLQTFADIRGTIISSAGRNATLTDRTVLWGEVLKLSHDPWLGSGWDNFWLRDRIAPLWDKWWWHPRSAHNGYIEIYLYLGWCGVVLLAFVLLAGFKRSIERFRSDVEYGGLALAFFFAALFQNYAESSFHRMSPIWFFFLLLSLVRMPEKRGAPEPGILRPSA
jgi:exopolysaccharide production protein ExoQ